MVACFGNSNAGAQGGYTVVTSTSGSGGSGGPVDAVVPYVGLLIGCTLALAALRAAYLRRHHIAHALTRCWKVRALVLSRRCYLLVPSLEDSLRPDCEGNGRTGLCLALHRLSLPRQPH